MKEIKKSCLGIYNDSEKLKRYKQEVETKEKKWGTLLEINQAYFDKKQDIGENSLSGIPFAVKDNIAVEGMKLTCGSKILEFVKSPYTSTAVKKLQEAGACVLGKANLDEFGMGSSTDNSALKQTNNPWDTERVAGGSSGGSAAAVAGGLVPFALGSDTGGSVRQPASFCGVYGLKPTYGSVSRYGLTAYASSLEVIGVLSKKVALMEEVFETIKGVDPMDQSTVEPDTISSEVKTIGMLPIKEGDTDEAVARSYEISRKRLEKLGYQLKEISFPELEYVVPAYYTIATAEASANLARFNGIRYGLSPIYAESPAELMKIARHNGFGDEVKLRVLLGTFVLRSGFQDQFYVRAQKIRTKIRLAMDKHFDECDALMMPVFPTPAFKHGSADMTAFQQKKADVYTCLANLAGVPALSVPSSVEEGLPVGVQFMAPAFGEGRLFRIAEQCEKEFPAPDCPDFLDMGEL